MMYDWCPVSRTISNDSSLSQGRKNHAHINTNPTQVYERMWGKVNQAWGHARKHTPRIK